MNLSKDVIRARSVDIKDFEAHLALHVGIKETDQSLNMFKNFIFLGPATNMKPSDPSEKAHMMLKLGYVTFAQLSKDYNPRHGGFTQYACDIATNGFYYNHALLLDMIEGFEAQSKVDGRYISHLENVKKTPLHTLLALLNDNRYAMRHPQYIEVIERYFEINPELAKREFSFGLAKDELYKNWLAKRIAQEAPEVSPIARIKL